MAIHNGGKAPYPVDFVQFSSRPKKGKVPYYLLAAQVRKRFLAQPKFNWRRQVKGAALTGNPERFIEIYRLNPLSYEPAIKALSPIGGPPPPFQRQLEEVLIERDFICDKDKEKEEQLRLQSFIRMDYLGDVATTELTGKPYFLHTTISLNSASDLAEFSSLKSSLLKIFEQYGLSLIVAGQKVGGDESKPEILNVWSFEAVEEVESLMMRLSDNLSYFKLNALGSQDQHIYRNVSRHYQFYPLLSHAYPGSGQSGHPVQITQEGLER